MQTKQASQPGMGRKLRRARAIVKKWEALAWPDKRTFDIQDTMKIYDEINKARYERAAALILAQKLSE